LRIVISFPKANESLRRKVERAEIEDLLDTNTGLSETWKLKHMPIPSNQLLPICVLSNLLETNKLRPIKDTWQEYDEYAIIIYNIYNHNDCFDHTLICLN